MDIQPNRTAITTYFCLAAFGFLILCGPLRLTANAEGKAETRTAEEVDKILPADAMKIATEHWDRLRDLQRQHRDTLQELQKAMADGQGNSKVAEQIAMMSRVAHADLDLCDTFQERQEACRKFIRDLDRLKQTVEKQADHTSADLLAIKSAWLSFEVEVERRRFDDRSPEEVQALLEHAKAVSQIYAEIATKNRMGARGGEADKVPYTGYVMCSSFAELLFALGKQEAAVEQLKQACEFADESAKATQAAYEAGTVTFALVLESQSHQADAWIALAKRDRKAAAELKGK